MSISNNQSFGMNKLSRASLVLGLTILLALVGFYLGHTIYGISGRTFLSTIAGALGGFGIGCASLDIHRRWRGV